MKLLNQLFNLLLPKQLYIAPLAVAGIAAGTGILGGILGNQGSETNSMSSSWKVLNPLDQFSQYAGGVGEQQFRSLEELLGQGPGAEDYQYGLSQQREYARNPFASASDLQRAQQFGEAAFAPQRMSLKQSFQDQMMQQRREASRLGRRSFDPVLNAQMGRGMLNALNQLGSQQSAFTANYADQKAKERVDLSQMLGQQAIANRQNLLSLGNQIFQQGQSFQLNTAHQYGSGTQSTPGPGFLAGALSGVSSGLGMASMFGGIGAGGGGSTAIANQPTFTSNMQFGSGAFSGPSPY